MNAIRSHRPAKYRLFWIPVAFFTFATLILSSGIFAGELPPKTETDQADEQIQIVADKLITNSAEKFAEFMGDVRTSQGNLVITSERLRIYYRDDPGRSKDQTGGRESIERLVASGHVQVSSEKYKAETHQAEYDMNTQVLVLTGENSTVRRGKNVLTGSKITVFRKNGQIKVESSPHKRIKAVFHPKENTSVQNPKE